MDTVVNLLENTKENLKIQLWWAEEHDKEVAFIEEIPILKQQIVEIEEVLLVLCGIKQQNKALPSNDLANWVLRNRWVYNFSDNKWWQYQESHNYIKKTTEEIADMILNNN